MACLEKNAMPNKFLITGIDFNVQILGVIVGAPLKNEDYQIQPLLKDQSICPSQYHLVSIIHDCL
jgi:hypothetical protein